MQIHRVLRDLNKLNAFVRVAERKSFTRAAEDLRTTPSVVSKHVRELETALGFIVLNRSTHGVSLTEPGAELLKHCLEMLEKIDQIVTDTRISQKLPHGTLHLQTIGEFSALIAGSVVARVLDRIPGLKLRHTESCYATDDPEQAADVILSTKHLTVPGFQEVELGSVDHVVCASPAYLARAGRPRDPKGLKDHNCICNLKSPTKEWQFTAGRQTTLVDVEGSLLSSGFRLACQAALSGLGIIRVPRKIVEAELMAGALVPILENDVASPERLFVYFSSGKALPQKTAEFISELKQELTASEDAVALGGALVRSTQMC